MKKHPIFAASINAAKKQKSHEKKHVGPAWIITNSLWHGQETVAGRKKSITLLFILLWMPHFISIFTV